MALLQQAPRGMSSKEAADRLGVNLRSVYRMRHHLADMGLDPATERRGWLQLPADSPQAKLSVDARARAALLSARLGDAEGAALRSAVKAGSLPVVLTPQAHAGELTGHLTAQLAELCRAGQWCELTLETRTVSGQASGLIVDRHLYVLLTQVPGERPQTHLRASRIRRAEAAEPPADFVSRPARLEHYVAPGWSAWGWGQRAQDVTLRVHPPALKAVRGSRRHPSEQWDGELLRLKVFPCREFIGWILGYAGQIEVLEPTALRREVTSRARTLLERHE